MTCDSSTIYIWCDETLSETPEIGSELTSPDCKVSPKLPVGPPETHIMLSLRVISSCYNHLSTLVSKGMGWWVRSVSTGTQSDTGFLGSVEVLGRKFTEVSYSKFQFGWT